MAEYSPFPLFIFFTETECLKTFMAVFSSFWSFRCLFGHFIGLVELSVCLVVLSICWLAGMAVGQSVVICLYVGWSAGWHVGWYVGLCVGL